MLTQVVLNFLSQLGKTALSKCIGNSKNTRVLQRFTLKTISTKSLLDNPDFAAAVLVGNWISKLFVFRSEFPSPPSPFPHLAKNFKIITRRGEFSVRCLVSIILKLNNVFWNLYQIKKNRPLICYFKNFTIIKKVTLFPVPLCIMF